MAILTLVAYRTHDDALLIHNFKQGNVAGIAECNDDLAHKRARAYLAAGKRGRFQKVNAALEGLDGSVCRVQVAGFAVEFVLQGKVK